MLLHKDLGLSEVSMMPLGDDGDDNNDISEDGKEREVDVGEKLLRTRKCKKHKPMTQSNFAIQILS